MEHRFPPVGWRFPEEPTRSGRLGLPCEGKSWGMEGRQMRREGQALTGSMGIDKGGAGKKITNYEVRITKWVAVIGGKRQGVKIGVAEGRGLCYNRGLENDGTF